MSTRAGSPHAVALRPFLSVVAAFLLASSAGGAPAPPDTSALDALTFYGRTELQAGAPFRRVVASVASLNAGLWAAENTTVAEAPWAHPPHRAGWETVVNTSAPACAGSVVNMSNAGGVATLPTNTAADPDLFLMAVYDLSLPECVAHCCTSAGCAAAAFYDTTDEGTLCQTFSAAFASGPQPWPSGHVLFAQGFVLGGGVPPPTVDALAYGLRSGAYLGGFATGGYELRADGSFALSTVRGQSPASEPWQGTVRDAVLAVALNGVAHVVRVTALGRLPPVPTLGYAARFPVARLDALGVSIYAYGVLTPGDSDASNTPAVAFTLRAANGGSAPMNVTLAVLQPLALRSDWRGVGAGAVPSPAGAANASACAAACALTAPCFSWSFDAAGTGCTLDGVRYALGANAAGIDSGNPGAWRRGSGTRTGGAGSAVFETTTVPGAAPLHNALGAQGLFALPPDSNGGVGAASAASVDELLAALNEADPAAALRGLPFGAPGHLHAAAAVTAVGVAPGATVDLTVLHAWHYPHFFWYRDAFGGSDVGQRYARTYPDVDAVVEAMNVSAVTQTHLAVQRVFDGLPDPLLADAAANAFAHSRSAQWHANGEYREWESFEFTDWGNPTNSDERHLPYFAYFPDAMEAQLWGWLNHTQNPDGSFFCIVVSAAGDRQWGEGDPCGMPSRANPHPDDVAMLLVAAYEQVVLANRTALAVAVWPRLRLAASYYATVYNSSAWGLPYQVHETYDAVPTAPGVVGEGNRGTSLFNALQYINALRCAQALARAAGDAEGEAQAGGLASAASAAVERRLSQGGVPFYVGDTAEGAADGNAVILEANGWPYHSSDGLHGQVLSHRLGFGDLLPRVHMALHTNYVLRDLGTPFGLKFSAFAEQNWLMADHASTALMLRWGEEGAWEPALRQLRHFHDGRREAGRHPAVISTTTGLPALLNYYGYAGFFWHTLSAFSGLQVDLPARRVSFSPHASAINATGCAALPLVLGGVLGVLALSPTAAELSLAAGAPLSFLTLTICQHVFSASPGAPLDVSVGAPLVLVLPTPCMPTPPSTLVTAAFCALSPTLPGNTSVWAGAPPRGPPIPPAAAAGSLADCAAAALAHHFCGYEWDAATSTCVLIPGSACYTVPRGGGVGGDAVTLGAVACDYSPANYTPPLLVNTSVTTLTPNATFGRAFAPIDSPAYTFVMPSRAGCAAQAAVQQACGWLWVGEWAGGAVGSCGPGATQPGCCVLDPYSGCAVGGPLPPSTGASPDAAVGIFGAIGEW